MPSSAFKFGAHPRLEDLGRAARGESRAALTPAVLRAVQKSRAVVERVASSRQAAYGINTGFGELSGVRIPPERLAALQRNLVLSHACGVGEPLTEAESRGILFLRLSELSRGYSGVRPELVRKLHAIFTAGIAPIIPSRGSVGASGDLAPQAHMALVAIGEGEALYRGRRMPAAKALKLAKIAPFVLSAKEGLALLNGTQAMQAVGGLALLDAERAWRAAQLACAMSLDALTGTPAPYDEDISRLKPQPGHAQSARILRRLMAGSQIRRSHIENDPRVQDPYSLRCAPQVHGAVWEKISSARATVEIEMASVTDNPIVVRGKIMSGGNFHGQSLAFAFDGAAAALAALANISERRTFQLTMGTAPRLKAFLARDPGVESGFMIAQYAAAALASEGKTLAHPASADSIPTSANKEDFVSMGMWAALKMKNMVWNAAQVVAIELVAAGQALEAHRPLRSGAGVEKGLAVLRTRVPLCRSDEALSGRLEEARRMVLAGAFDDAVGR